MIAERTGGRRRGRARVPGVGGPALRPAGRAPRGRRDRAAGRGADARPGPGPLGRGAPAGHGRQRAVPARALVGGLRRRRRGLGAEPHRRGRPRGAPGPLPAAGRARRVRGGRRGPARGRPPRPRRHGRGPRDGGPRRRHRRRPRGRHRAPAARAAPRHRRVAVPRAAADAALRGSRCGGAARTSRATSSPAASTSPSTPPTTSSSSRRWCGTGCAPRPRRSRTAWPPTARPSTASPATSPTSRRRVPAHPARAAAHRARLRPDVPCRGGARAPGPPTRRRGRRSPRPGARCCTPTPRRTRCCAAPRRCWPPGHAAARPPARCAPPPRPRPRWGRRRSSTRSRASPAARASTSLHAGDAVVTTRDDATRAGRRDAPPSSPSLTSREHEVLAVMAEGLSNRQIAQRLYISERTVAVHVSRVLDQDRHPLPHPGRRPAPARPSPVPPADRREVPVPDALDENNQRARALAAQETPPRSARSSTVLDADRRDGGRARAAGPRRRHRCFSRLYHRSPSTSSADYEAGGLFRRGDFICELDLAFAQRYLDALARLTGRAPDPGLLAAPVRPAPGRRPAEWRFAVVGVNAHVNFDLAFALLDVWEATRRRP